jgi:hypothetical protein
MRTAKKVLTALRLWDPWPCPLCQKSLGMDHSWRPDFFEQMDVSMRHLKWDCPVILAPPRS